MTVSFVKEPSVRKPYITDLMKFETTVRKFGKKDLKLLLEHLAFRRILYELVLVDTVRTCRQNGEMIPKTETLLDYESVMKAERILIGLLGRRESAKVYGIMEGKTSAMITVDYILTNDSVQYYSELIKIPEEAQKHG